MISLSNSSPGSAIHSAGNISYAQNVDVTVDTSTMIGSNNLSLGYMLDWDRWIDFIQNPTLRGLAIDAGFKLVRVFDFRPTTPPLMPCTYWNETSETGTWNWINVDTLTKTLLQTGAEPLFCLGYGQNNIQNYVPQGMAVNPITRLPYPQSYALYAAEWVKHFQAVNLPVRYYEIMNEPYSYFGWNASNMTRLAYYVELWNATAELMRQANPNVLLSQDSITMKNVLDYWIGHGDDVDFLDFHKYDENNIGQCTDAEMFERAETNVFQTSASYYGVDDARQKWYNARSELLPVIDSESNFDSAWQNGSDPEIQQMAGATWLALNLRMAILERLSYSVYFELASSKSEQGAHGTGWGFGMINKDDNQPWFPYYVLSLIGQQMKVGDNLLDSSSSSDDIRALAWSHDGLLNILIICKANASETISLKGVNPTGFNVFKIDNSVLNAAPYIQNSKINPGELLQINGLTVALLQQNSA